AGQRCLWYLILGGVFERHPSLRLVFTETAAEWIPVTLRELDSLYASRRASDFRKLLPRKPSEYWYDNCYAGVSFMAPFEAELRHASGINNLMWGRDYPHEEGTWPYPSLSMRHTFAGVPPEDARLLLGENAARVHGLDLAKLRTIADRIGPTVGELSVPISP